MDNMNIFFIAAGIWLNDEWRMRNWILCWVCVLYMTVVVCVCCVCFARVGNGVFFGANIQKIRKLYNTCAEKNSRTNISTTLEQGFRNVKMVGWW